MVLYFACLLTQFLFLMQIDLKNAVMKMISVCFLMQIEIAEAAELEQLVR